MQALTTLVGHYDWIWPLCEIIHFMGLILLIGTVGLIDLRVLGIARQLPLVFLYRLVPSAIFGFILCLLTGLVFILGDPFKTPMDTLTKLTFQIKMFFVAVGLINALLFEYYSDFRQLSQVEGFNDEAPKKIKIIAGTSLAVWLSVVYLGRMLPYGDSFYFIFYW